MAGLFVLAVFWMAVVGGFVDLGVRTPLIFAGLWVLGAAVAGFLPYGGAIFLAYEAILALWLIMLIKTS